MCDHTHTQKKVHSVHRNCDLAMIYKHAAHRLKHMLQIAEV